MYEHICTTTGMATHAQPSSGSTTCEDTQGVAKMLVDLKVKRKRLRHGVPLYTCTICDTGFVKMEYRDCENGVQGFMSNTPIYMYIVIIHRL